MTLVRYALLLFLLSSLDAFAADRADPPVSAGSTFDEQGGEALYRGICQGCHMADGRGASSGAGAYPSLRANPRLMAAGYSIYVVIHGKNGMPALSSMLSDEQIADVLNYVRSHFDNHDSDTVTPEDVKKQR